MPRATQLVAITRVTETTTIFVSLSLMFRPFFKMLLSGCELILYKHFGFFTREAQKLLNRLIPALATATVNAQRQYSQCCG
ncbi:hypothetical protein C5S36_08360 [Candidatus Methanophagaceae archaeon]|jgi:hypothetical protein|nr:hypothetical protein C5S36_08360 [Methanophagales archaeon]